MKCYPAGLAQRIEALLRDLVDTSPGSVEHAEQINEAEDILEDLDGSK